MNKLITPILILIFFFIYGFGYSQTTLIYFLDFENTDTTVIKLNSPDNGSNNGPNKWIINKNYVGQPTYKNTIPEDSTFGGLITHPDSNYLHIYDSNISA